MFVARLSSIHGVITFAVHFRFSLWRWLHVLLEISSKIEPTWETLIFNPAPLMVLRRNYRFCLICSDRLYFPILTIPVGIVTIVQPFSFCADGSCFCRC
jgi:hypothetical protein